jgi:hypothetical protein
MAATTNFVTRTRERIPGKLDDGVLSSVEVWPPAYTAQTNSLDFAGDSSHYIGRDDYDALFDDAECSVMIWVKRDIKMTTSNNWFTFEGTGNTNELNLRSISNVGNEEKVYTSYYDGAGVSRHYTDSGNSYWTDDAWIQVIVTHSNSGDVTTNYKNASQNTQDTDSLTWGTSSRRMWRLFRHLDCRVHSIAYWDTVLDTDAITALYNSGDSDTDLNVDSGNYDYSGNLVAWFRLGHQDDADVDLGYNYSAVTEDKTAYNLMEDSTGITTADVVVDAP